MFPPLWSVGGWLNGLLKLLFAKGFCASAAEGPIYLALPKPKIGQKINGKKSNPTVNPSLCP